MINITTANAKQKILKSELKNNVQKNNSNSENVGFGTSRQRSMIQNLGLPVVLGLTLGLYGCPKSTVGTPRVGEVQVQNTTPGMVQPTAKGVTIDSRMIELAKQLQLKQITPICYEYAGKTEVYGSDAGIQPETKDVINATAKGLGLPIKVGGIRVRPEAAKALKAANADPSKITAGFSTCAEQKTTNPLTTAIGITGDIPNAEQFSFRRPAPKEAPTLIVLPAVMGPDNVPVSLAATGNPYEQFVYLQDMITTNKAKPTDMVDPTQFPPVVLTAPTAVTAQTAPIQTPPSGATPTTTTPAQGRRLPQLPNIDLSQAKQEFTPGNLFIRGARFIQRINANSADNRQPARIPQVAQPNVQPVVPQTAPQPSTQSGSDPFVYGLALAGQTPKGDINQCYTTATPVKCLQGYNSAGRTTAQPSTIAQPAQINQPPIAKTQPIAPANDELEIDLN